MYMSAKQVGLSIIIRFLFGGELATSVFVAGIVTMIYTGAGGLLSVAYTGAFVSSSLAGFFVDVHMLDKAYNRKNWTRVRVWYSVCVPPPRSISS